MEGTGEELMKNKDIKTAYLISGLKNNMNKFSRGAEAGTDAPRQNPVGASSRIPHHSVSAKEGTSARWDTPSYLPANRTFWQPRSKVPVGSRGATAYFGKRVGPGFGSWATGVNFVSLFWDMTLGL